MKGGLKIIVCSVVVAFLIMPTVQVKMQKSLDFIRNELSKNEDLKLEQLKTYIRQVAPAYIIRKGDRSTDQLAIDSVKNNRYEFHRYLSLNKFNDIINPDLPNLRISMLAFCFVCGLAVLMILCAGLRKVTFNVVKRNVSSRINEIMKDLLVLLVLTGLLKLIDYFELIPFRIVVVILNDIQLLLSEFCVVYIIVNIVCIVYAQRHIANWMDFETYVPDRVELYREFERLYIENIDGVLDKDSLPKYEKLKKVMKFISLRQEFLSPTFVPLLKESVLRDDFKFADYLGKVYYKTLRNVASLRPFSLVSFFVLFILYLFVRLISSDDAEVYVMCILSIVFYLMMLVLKIGSQNIFYRLSRPLKSPYEFTVQPFDAVRNPLANLDKILTPYYLRDNFDHCYVSDKRLINPQESMFIFSSPELCIRLLHLNLFAQIIWMILFYTNYLFELDGVIRIGCCALATGLSLVSMFYLFPVTSRNFTLITNIEMMKDQEIIEECIAEQKAETAAAFCKLYRMVKTIKKERFAGGDLASSDGRQRSDDHGIINIVLQSCRNAFNKLKDVSSS